MAILQLVLSHLCMSMNENAKVADNKIEHKTWRSLRLNGVSTWRSDVMFFFIVFIRSSPDIRLKCYKNRATSRTKKENIEIYENRMLSVIKVGIEPMK